MDVNVGPNEVAIKHADVEDEGVVLLESLSIWEALGWTVVDGSAPVPAPVVAKPAPSPFDSGNTTP